jgi:hypothetical protein
LGRSPYSLPKGQVFLYGANGERAARADEKRLERAAEI